MKPVIVLLVLSAIPSTAAAAHANGRWAPARATVDAAQATPSPPGGDPEFTTSTRTGPGVGKPATHDEFATQGWRGVAFVLLALVMIAWILRARARDPKIPPDEPWPDD